MSVGLLSPPPPTQLEASPAGPRVTDPYHPDANAETFDVAAYLAGLNQRLLSTSDGRRILTRLDPLLFGLVYMRKHLRDKTTRDVTFADPHFTWVQEAREWIRPMDTPRGHRRAYVAPRDCGKSTWWFLILPMWAAAHGHVHFAAAFADSGTQAELHLATFKRELSDNPLLRRDFPDLCEPARRHNGKTINDSQQMLYTRSGFAFAARGIDATSLGLKVDEHRPDLLIFDDVEPDESNYSEYQMTKRLSTIQDAILPLNEFARVVLVGTVTMPGSIVHQLVRAAQIEQTGSDEQPEQWILDQRFETHHTMPIPVREDGSERSVWPAKWTLEYLNTIRHTRSYLKNYANDPVGLEGGFWNLDTFRYGRLPGVMKRILSIDPTVTTKKRSDYAGISIIGYAPARVERHGGQPVKIPAAVQVEFAQEVKKTGAALRAHVLRIIALHPDPIDYVLIETNQGGENWRDIFHSLPAGIKLICVTETVPKEVRAANALNHYEMGRVLHTDKHTRLQEQMCAFPRAPHDDMLDSVCAVVNRLLDPDVKARRRDRVLYPQ